MDRNSLRAWIDEQKEDFLAQLEMLVNQNSFTDNIVGVDRAMDMFCELCEEHNLHIEVVHGRHRLIKAGNGSRKRIMLIAHMDTVHPLDSDFNCYQPTEEGFIFGPGIGDIKGGLLMGMYTLLAMQKMMDDCDVQLFVGIDEEIGSPTIRDWYMANKLGADYALGLEPGFPQAELTPDVQMGVVQQRKGSGRVRFVIKGKAAHSGGNWTGGLSAIEAVAQRISKIHALTDLERGITTNVGVVEGGTAANTIPDRCEALVDFRYLTQADGEETRDAIYKIVHTPTLHNPHLDIWDEVDDYELLVFMPPMEKSDANSHLIEVVLENAKRLGQDVVPIVRGGGSDANYVSGGGVPSICGMGAPAQGIHTKEEKILEPMLWDRLELLINTVYQLSQEG